MKCLSLWQPWESLIVTGRNRVESRGWPIRHRGPLLIHAAKTWNGQLADICLTEPFRSALAELGVPPLPHSFTGHDIKRKKEGWDQPFGAIVGRVDVIDCYPTTEIGSRTGFVDGEPVRRAAHQHACQLLISQTEWEFGDYSAGRYGFLLANPVRFPSPLPYRGAQGLFDVPDHLVAPAGVARPA